MPLKIKIIIIILAVLLVLAIGFVALKIYSDRHVLDRDGMIYNPNAASDTQNSTDGAENSPLKKYKVTSDYDYIGLKDAYSAGEKVTFEFYYATDTSYTCTVNGKRIEPTPQDGMLVYEFIMPAQDVEIKTEAKNTMYTEVENKD